MIMINKNKYIKRISNYLKILFPDPVCALNSDKPHELLIAARLSAQCTDKRVNLVTPALFKHFPSITAFAEADMEEVEEYIKSCGLYKTKARDIVLMCRILAYEYNGRIPDIIEELIKLPGVGRKTANLIIGDIYNKPAVVTDTHVIRIANRLGLINSKNPLTVEKDLREILPPSESNDFCHRTVLFGREICKAQNPKCDICKLTDICNYL